MQYTEQRDYHYSLHSLLVQSWLKNKIVLFRWVVLA